MVRTFKLEFKATIPGILVETVFNDSESKHNFHFILELKSFMSFLSFISVVPIHFLGVNEQLAELHIIKI